MDKMDKNWPAWRYGPDGQSEIFTNEADVPAGWKDHPSKVADTIVKGTGNENPGGVQGQPAKGAPTAIGNTNPGGGAGGGTGDTSDVDADGWPWDSELHASTRSKTQDGKWRMKVGVSRPDPKPGYPKLDL